MGTWVSCDKARTLKIVWYCGRKNLEPGGHLPFACGGESRAYPGDVMQAGGW